MSVASVDIVIVSFNASEDLERCLLALRMAPSSVPARVIVVDNASRDDSVEIARGSLPVGDVIALPENVGFAQGNNVGIRAGTGDLILLLNSDAVLPPGSLDALAAALQADATAAAIGPRLVDRDRQAELSFGRMMSPLSEFRQKVLVKGHAKHVALISAHVERITRQRRYVDWVSGACLLVWRKDAEAVGLLDERYFMYAEDVDFCAALRARGRRILFEPAVEVVHRRGASAAKAAEATRAAYRRSQVAFYAKHHPRWHRILTWYLRAKGQRPG